jgi:hypothetical protein
MERELVEKKVYSCKISKKSAVAAFAVAFAVFGLCMWARANTVEICEWIYEIALKETVNNFKTGFLVVGALFLLLVPVFILILSLHIEEIVFSKDGVSFKRRFRSFTIQKITDLEILKSRGKERGLRITGFTHEGKKIRKALAREGDVKKKWEEFKKDLQKIKSK